MNRARSPLPDRIPPSYYARPPGTVPGPTSPPTPWQAALRLLGSLVPASVALASGAWGMRRRVPLLGSALGSANPAHLAAGCALAACLLAGLVLGVRSAGSSPPAAGHPAGHARPPVLAAGPTAAPVLVSPSPPPTAPATPSPSPSPTPSPTPLRTPTPAPPPIAFLNAPLSSVSQGQSVTLLVRTAPGTTCSIAVGYQPAPGLNPATANGAGQVSWTWRVSRQTQPGTWPITVTCGGSTATTQIVLNDGGN